MVIPPSIKSRQWVNKTPWILGSKLEGWRLAIHAGLQGIFHEFQEFNSTISRFFKGTPMRLSFFVFSMVLPKILVWLCYWVRWGFNHHMGVVVCPIGQQNGLRRTWSSTWSIDGILDYRSSESHLTAFWKIIKMQFEGGREGLARTTSPEHNEDNKNNQTRNNKNSTSPRVERSACVAQPARRAAKRTSWVLKIPSWVL